MKNFRSYIVFCTGVCMLLVYLNWVGWSAFGTASKKRTGPPGPGGRGYRSSYHK